MEKIVTDEIDPIALATDADRRQLTEPIAASDLAINRFDLAPGESMSGSLHTHLDQEEIFYVLDGEVTFETAPAPDAPTETVAVGADEVIRFAPGEYQEGRNEGDRDAVTLALGAPQESTEVRIAEDCPSCDSSAMDYAFGDDGLYLECPECGETAQPEG